MLNTTLASAKKIDETNMNFGMPNSQKGMNKIHREFHSANNLTQFCTNETSMTGFVTKEHV